MFKSDYTDILREAIAIAEDAQKRDGNGEWTQVLRECRKEIYHLHKQIDHTLARQRYESRLYGNSLTTNDKADTIEVSINADSVPTTVRTDLSTGLSTDKQDKS